MLPPGDGALLWGLPGGYPGVAEGPPTNPGPAFGVCLPSDLSDDCESVDC